MKKIIKNVSNVKFNINENNNKKENNEKHT